METKHCGGCSRDLPRSMFWKNTRKADGLQTQCKECLYSRQKDSRKTVEGKRRMRRQNASPGARASRARYARTPEGKTAASKANASYFAKVRTESRALAREAKSVPCMDCGQTFHYSAMDFDHVRGEKRGNVATMASQTYSIESIKREMAKCEVVCSNCHRVRTHQRRTEKSRAE